ncbi:MAG: hypothetical protein H7X70_00310 [Candidatus Kapabacteria bacterium]|nr:hypothetical protein [Candidatus Kapabacteria bacterium]
MNVMKFGGAVLRDPEGFRRMVQIVREAPLGETLVVVSAFSSATRDLESAAILAQQGQLPDALARIDQVTSDHVALAKVLLPIGSSAQGVQTMLQGARQELATLLEGVATTRQLTAKTLDRILVFGEFLALHIARHVLQEAGLDVAGVDAQNLIVTNAEHGNASPLPEKTALRVEHELLPAFEKHKIVVVQGFVGRTEDGAATTMGKESSNLTATILGSLLHAKEVVIFTDVEGVRSSDPRVCADTVLRPHLSYDQARIAAHHGLKLLYPTMIEPAVLSGIPIRIASAEHPRGESTVIDVNDGHCDPILIINSGETDTELTTVFIHCAQWLPAATIVVQSLHQESSCDVHTSHEDNTATLRVPIAIEIDVARRLHTELSNSAQKHETRSR